MKNKLVDKKSFYKLIAEIFENLHGHVAFMSGVDDKERYCKIDDDFYKCKVENAFLVDFNMNQIFATSKPISVSCFCENCFYVFEDLFRLFLYGFRHFACFRVYGNLSRDEKHAVTCQYSLTVRSYCLRSLRCVDYFIHICIFLFVYHYLFY